MSRVARTPIASPPDPLEGEPRRQTQSGVRRLLTHPAFAALVSALATMGLLIFLFAVTSHQPSKFEPWSRNGFSFDASPVRIDRPAPSINLGFVDRTGVARLADFKGKTVVLNFWASWCTACRSEAPRLRSLWESYRSKGVVFLGADESDSADAATSFARRFGLGYPSVSDPSEALAIRYGVYGLPTTFVIDPSGRLRYVVVGRVSPTAFARALDSVLARS